MGDSNSGHSRGGSNYGSSGVCGTCSSGWLVLGTSTLQESNGTVRYQ